MEPHKVPHAMDFHSHINFNKRLETKLDMLCYVLDINKTNKSKTEDM